METTFIYGLKDPRTDIIRYVGKTDDTDKRIISHIANREYRDTYKDRWIQTLIRDGVSPDIEIIDEVSKDNWEFWEKHYIKLFKSLGAKLVNTADGGKGGVSAEVAEKISKARMGRFYGKNNHRAKFVFQYGMNGFFMRKWDSMNMAAKELGIDRGGITKCCSDKYYENSCGGYMWSHRMAGKLKYKNRKEKPVLQADRKGEVVMEWSSCKEAVVGMNISSKYLNSICRKGKAYRGFYWKYKNES